jgi:hypothetical protein
MTLGTTATGETVTMKRVHHSRWALFISGAQYGPLDSFAACVVRSWQLVPYANRTV